MTYKNTPFAVGAAARVLISETVYIIISEMGMKNENIVRILLLSIGAFLVFIGLFGGIIASGDFLSGGFSVVVGILFLSFSHKMKEIIKEQTIEKMKMLLFKTLIKKTLSKTK
ncbi:hypothetical protein O3Q48_00915 [Enterococcus lactis]